jgi:branched-chain amino acid transport system permease protein
LPLCCWCFWCGRPAWSAGPATSNGEATISDNRHWIAFALLGAGVLLVALVPWLAGNYAVRVATAICLSVTLALSWNFIGGYAGYPSFATAAFFGFGAYAGAILQTKGTPMVLAWFAALALTAAFAWVLGFAILRLRGHYFAVGSFAVLELAKLAASTWTGLTGGGTGLNVPILPGGPEFAGRVFLYAMLGLALVTFSAAVYVDRSRLGFGLRCIRQNESAANMLGVDVDRLKIAAFVLSGMFVGACGAIYASWVSYIDPTDSFSILMTIKVPVMVLLGGAGTLFGPIVGVVAFQLLEEKIWSSFLDIHSAVLGLVIVLLVFLLPGGLVCLPARFGRMRPARAAP